MRKRVFLSTVCLTLLLTACGSNDKSEEKKFSTETKAEPSAEIKKMNELEKKIATAKVTQASEPKEVEKQVSEKEAPQKTETYVKNIFELTTIDGKKIHVNEVENGVTFEEHKNKIVFLLFFGHRCPPCLGEIPALEKLVEEKGDKLEVIAIEVQRLPEEQLKKFKIAKKINYTLLSGEDAINSKFISYIAERAQWTGSIPFLVGIMPNGEVGTVHVGGMGLGEMKATFDQLSK